MSSRLTPNEPFPEDLAALPTDEVEVLNSRVHRELDFEHQHSLEAEPETEFRSEELQEELDVRDLLEEVEPDVDRLLSGAGGQADAAPGHELNGRSAANPNP